jgi:hypothetical protein
VTAVGSAGGVPVRGWGATMPGSAVIQEMVARGRVRIGWGRLGDGARFYMASVGSVRRRGLGQVGCISGSIGGL